MPAYLWVFAEGNAGAKVVIEAMVAFVGLQQLNNLVGTELLCVLLGHLHDQLQILLHVDVQQLLQTKPCETISSAEKGCHPSF